MEGISMSAPATVVIPTFNGRSLLAEHLSSVEKMLRGADQLLVIDDASTDDTIEWLQKRYTLQPIPQNNTNSTDILEYRGALVQKHATCIVRVVSLANNVRFARAVNTAVRYVTTPVFLLLNNDVQPASDVLDVLTPLFYEDSVFAVGCHEYEDEKRSIEGGKNRLWFERGVFQHARADEFSSGPTAWVSGGSGMFATDKWQLLGGFDEAFYPAYWEDTDLSMRARKHGWKVLFSHEAVVYHYHETSNKKAFGDQKIRELSWRHQQYFTRKHANSWQLLQYYCWQPYWWWKMKVR